MIGAKAFESWAAQLRTGGVPRCVVLSLILVSSPSGWAQSIAAAKGAKLAREACPRPSEGSVVVDPTELRSQNGHLAVVLAIRSSPDTAGDMRYCYVDEQEHQAPTLRVHPGDILSVTLKNEISPAKSASSSPHAANHSSSGTVHGGGHDPCTGGPMTAASANLHFHGLSVPPVCHQDETLKTVIEPGDRPFEYRLQIPKSQPPGLDWYHPHVHGFSEQHILGGASGALIVEGMDSAVPRVADLPERIFVIRDQKIPAPGPSDKLDPLRPTKQLSVNYIPVPYPKYPPAVIKMRPTERQLWRVLNASADTYLNLSVEFAGKPQSLDLVALDGAPLRFGQPGAPTYVSQASHVFLPPAARAEFIVTGPPEGVPSFLVTSHVNRGASDDGMPVGRRPGASPAVRTGQDDLDPARPLASVVAVAHLLSPAPVKSSWAKSEPPSVPLTAVRPTGRRKLFFSETLVDPNDPSSATQFFITEDGHSPVIFDPASSVPTITVHQGDVEDWTIENRSQESHTFHIHQLHFIVVGSRGSSWEEPTLRDTIDVPAWDGFRTYPSVTVRLDFRDPNVVGTFPFHCHILQHLDGGMMGTVRVEPASREPQRSQAH